MKSLRHILLGAVIAIVLFCSFGFYDTENISDGTKRNFGTGLDVSFEWDGTNFEMFAAAIDTPWAIGGATYGFDTTYYFETEGTVAFDYDGDSVTFSDTISLVFGTGLDWSISSSTAKILQLTPLGDETYAIYVGADTAGADLNLFGAITTDHWTYDASVGTMTMQSTSESTDTGVSVKPIYMYSVMDGAGGVGGRAEFHTYTNKAAGAWINALKGYLEIGTSGTSAGLSSAIVAEMLLPGTTLSSGTYAPLEIEIVTQASGVYNTATQAVQYIQISGNQTATDTWEDGANLLFMVGLTAAEGNIFCTDADPTTDATLRINIDGTPYYILLSNSQTE